MLPQGLEFVTLGPVVNAKGDVFVGQWRNGQRWGRGEFFWKDGNYYIGTWEKGQVRTARPQIRSRKEKRDFSPAQRHFLKERHF